MLSITIKGLKAVQKRVEKYGNKVDKAVLTAMRVEGFRAKSLMQREIRAGAPGGRRFAPLSLIRQTQGAYKGGGLRRKTALYALAKGIRYLVPRGKMQLHIGFVGPQYATLRSDDGFAQGYRFDKKTNTGEKGWSRSTIVGSTWRRLARMNQEGFTKSADEKADRYSSKTLRESLAFYGSSIDGKRFSKSRSRRRNVFFLRKETRQLRTPARPIMVPFWERHHQTIRRNIAENTIKKMRGEKI